MSGEFVPDLSWQDASPAARDPYYGEFAPCPECGFVHESRECVECLDAGPDPDGCEGAIEYRMPLSGTGRSFPRCEKHWGERLDRQREIDERYPVHQPADFDPSYAGEVWSEDDY
jgi:hypothetical protein